MIKFSRFITLINVKVRANFSKLNISCFKSRLNQRNTLLLFFGFFFFAIIIILYLTRFLLNAWTAFHEIFRDGVNWSRKTANNFLCDDVTSGPRNWRFSDFMGVIFWRYLLRNDWRYLLQIFTDDKQKFEIVPDNYVLNVSRHKNAGAR